MSRGPESYVVDAIRKYLEEQGAYVINKHGGGYGKNGEPDLLACLKGRFIGVEAKAKDGKPTKLQLHRLRQLGDAGAVAVVAWSVDDVVWALTEEGLV